MSTQAIELARAKRAQMKAEGKKPNMTVVFTPEEVAALVAGVERTDIIEGSSVRDYIKEAAKRQALLDVQKPKRVMIQKSVEQLKAEAQKLLDLAAKREAQG